MGLSYIGNPFQPEYESDDIEVTNWSNFPLVMDDEDFPTEDDDTVDVYRNDAVDADSDYLPDIMEDSDDEASDDPYYFYETPSEVDSEDDDEDIADFDEDDCDLSLFKVPSDGTEDSPDLHDPDSD